MKQKTPTRRLVHYYIRGSVIFTFFFLLLFLIIHIDFQQSDEHSKQDAEELQIGSSFSHLIKGKKILLVTLHSNAQIAITYTSVLFSALGGTEGGCTLCFVTCGGPLSSRRRGCGTAGAS